MALFFSIVLILMAVLLAIPVAILFLEVVCSFCLAKSAHPERSGREHGSVAVLVPAHNEGDALLPTLRDIAAQLHAGDRLLVIADNCTDNTAAVAKAAGAEVIERNDPTKIGKGYALDFAVQHLRSSPPSVVLVFDADCRLGDAAVDNLVAACIKTARPAQAVDLMIAPPASGVNYQVAEFAWRLKNLVRPLGLRALNLPCQLMGTGMAFPWKLIEAADIATASLVEDLKLGLDLARAGFAPLFCPFATVTSVFPISALAARTQRSRWEKGHISLLLNMVPKGLYEAIIYANRDLLVLVLNLSVPPLSLLVLLLLFLLIASLLATLFGIPALALIINVTSLIALAFALLLAWLRWGRDILPARSLLSVISYILGKLPIYRQLFLGTGESKWTRTERKNGQ